MNRDEFYDALAHSAKGTSWEKKDHAYTSKTKKNGKWRYTYDSKLKPSMDTSDIKYNMVKYTYSDKPLEAAKRETYYDRGQAAVEMYMEGQNAKWYTEQANNEAKDAKYWESKKKQNDQTRKKAEQWRDWESEDREVASKAIERFNKNASDASKYDTRKKQQMQKQYYIKKQLEK